LRWFSRFWPFLSRKSSSKKYEATPSNTNSYSRERAREFEFDIEFEIANTVPGWLRPCGRLVLLPVFTARFAERPRRGRAPLTKNAPAAGGTGQMYFDDIRLYRPAE
jgi:hypothetical protein